MIILIKVTALPYLLLGSIGFSFGTVCGVLTLVDIAWISICLQIPISPSSQINIQGPFIYFLIGSIQWTFILCSDSSMVR